MTRTVIKTSKAPVPVAPYSQAIAVNGTVYCSGQLGLIPGDGLKLISDNVLEQAKQALKNLTAVLEEAGCQLSDVVKVTVFLTNMSDFVAVNEVYSTFFSAPFPARTAYQVAALPLGGRVEIEAIAVQK